MDKNIDNMLKELVHERIDNIDCPAPDEIWQNIRLKLRKHDKIVFFTRRLRPVYITGVVIITSIILFANFQVPVMAFTSSILKSIETIAGNTLTIHKKIVDNGKQAIITKSVTEDPRIDEARKKVSFNLVIPEYVPLGYDLYKVNVLNKGLEQETVIIFFADKIEGDYIQITQTHLSEDADFSMNIQKDKDTLVKHIKINGIEYLLVKYEKYLNKLIWDDGNINYKIDGRISEGEIIKIAKSMK